MISDTSTTQLSDSKYSRKAKPTAVTANSLQKFSAVLQPATSYLASNDPSLHFGLGSAASIDSIEVLWPDGVKEKFSGEVNKALTLKKGTR